MIILLKRASLLLLLAAIALGTASLARAQAISPSKDEISYRVKPGDSLIALGTRYFLTADSYKIVAQANSLENANRLRVGSTITIPISVLKFTRFDARIIAYKGHASVSRNGRAEAVTLQTRLSEGQVIETGEDGYLTMQLANGSKISIPSNSRFRISRMRTYLLTGGVDLDFMVERGRSETTAARLKDSRSRFRIRTPVAVSAVRGTVFRIGYDGPDAPSLTEVVEGNVAMNLTATGAQTAIPGGFGAAGRTDGKLNREELLPPPTFTPGMDLQRQTNVVFALQPSAGAVGYQVQVAKDQAFTDVVVGARSDRPQIDLGPLPGGQYYVRAMAIAPSGLIGMPRTEPFVRRLQLLVSRQFSANQKDWQLNWDLGGPADASYRVQVFDAARPDVPIIDEPALPDRSLTITGLPPGNYTWRVGLKRPIDGNLQQSWTPFEGFTLGN